ncbi:MAG TPA: DUF5916 domain-containing protein [Vicinamibacterales bacterium]|nr:DUF5916 domain-containing protein [Vicinamibacterales bacterium]
MRSHLLSSWRACAVALALSGGPLAAAPAPGQPAALTADGRPLPVAPAVIAGNRAGVTVRATRIATPLIIDGQLDDRAYREVTPITEFVQQDPQEGAPVSEQTEAWVLFDDRNIYVACRCLDQHPERMVANEMRRDSTNLRQNDNFAVELDTFHDKRNGFLFYVTPVGGMWDSLTTDERSNNGDWNTVWEAKGRRTADGWIAEIAIPFKSLRYKPGRDQVWGINLRRGIRHKNENAYISPIKPQWGVGGIFHVSAAATLVGLEAPPSAKNLEIKPALVNRLTTDRVAVPSVANRVTADLAVDAKYGLTKSLTADFTYNTDFAQVEADEVQVNLTRFSLQFPEKRDFFLEGQGMFQFGAAASTGSPPPTGASPTGGAADAPTIFYSRQIGLSNGVVVPILGGGRVSGRAGQWSIGALNIASKADTAAKVPQTDFTVLRVRRDVLRRSTVGMMVANRSQSTVAPGANTLVGLDGSFSFFQNVYVSGYAAATSTPTKHGDRASYRGNFTYGSDRYGLSVDRMTVDRNFNPEVGFVPRQNVRRTFASARFSPRPRHSRIVRRFSYESGYNYETDDTNRLESREVQADYRIELQNSDVLSVEAFRNYELLRRPLGLAPNVRVPPGTYGFSHLRTALALGQQHRLSGVAAFDAGEFYDGRKQTLSLNARLGFTPQLGVEPNVSLNWVERAGVAALVRATGARTTFTVTPRMFVSALVQYASATHSLSTNFRFRWEYQPGSELFVVYTDGHDTAALPGVPGLQNRGVVIKANRLFRL